MSNTAATILQSYKQLEERDASDAVTHAGTVSKHSPFSSSDNAGIYDAIATDLRVLKEAVESVADDADMTAIETAVKSMYDDMRTNPNFGSTEAKAQAEEAFKQAQAAASSAASAKTYADKATSVSSAISAVESYLKTISDLEKSVSDNAQVATNKAAAASTSETNTKTSETNAKTSETNAASSASAASTSAVNAATYEKNAAASATTAASSQTAAKTSETNAAASQSAAKTSETNAKASQTAAKTSETNAAASASSASKSADSAKAWAVSTSSPDGVSDSDSPTGKTQSARTWSLAAAANAKAVTANTKAVADNTAKVQSIVDDATKAIQIKASGDWGITAAKAKADADGNTISTTYLKRSGGTMTGVLNLANNAWNAIGDNAAIGDHNRAGHICVKGLNAPTGIAMYKQGSDSDSDAAHIVYNGSTINIDKRLTGLAAQFYIDSDGYLAYRDAL